MLYKNFESRVCRAILKLVLVEGSNQMLLSIASEQNLLECGGDTVSNVSDLLAFNINEVLRTSAAYRLAQQFIKIVCGVFQDTILYCTQVSLGNINQCVLLKVLSL